MTITALYSRRVCSKCGATNEHKLIAEHPRAQYQCRNCNAISEQAQPDELEEPPLTVTFPALPIDPAHEAIVDGAIKAAREAKRGNGKTPAPFEAVKVPEPKPPPIATAAVDAIREREAVEVAQLRESHRIRMEGEAMLLHVLGRKPGEVSGYSALVVDIRELRQRAEQAEGERDEFIAAARRRWEHGGGIGDHLVLAVVDKYAPPCRSCGSRIEDHGSPYRRCRDGNRIANEYEPDFERQARGLTAKAEPEGAPVQAQAAGGGEALTALGVAQQIYFSEDELAKKIEQYAREQVAAARKRLRESSWLWAEDGSNDLGGMSDGMSIVLTAGTLRALLATATPADVELASLGMKLAARDAELEKVRAELESLRSRHELRGKTIERWEAVTEAGLSKVEWRAIELGRHGMVEDLRSWFDSLPSYEEAARLRAEPSAKLREAAEALAVGALEHGSDWRSSWVKVDGERYVALRTALAASPAPQATVERLHYEPRSAAAVIADPPKLPTAEPAPAPAAKLPTLERVENRSCYDDRIAAIERWITARDAKGERS